MMPTINSKIISILRFPLTFLVVVIHSRGEVTHVLDWSHLTMADVCSLVKVFLSDGVAQIAVPTFFFISGYLFFYQLEKLDLSTYKRKLKSRFHTLFVPFVLWNLLCIPLTMLVFYGESLGGTSLPTKAVDYWNNIPWGHIFWDYTSHHAEYPNLLGMPLLLNGPVLGTFWYVRDLILIVLLSPVFYWFLKRTGKYGAMLLLLLLCFRVWPYMTLRVQCLYFVLGGYWSMNKHNLYIENKVLRKLNYLLTVGLLLFLTAVGSYEHFWGFQLITLYALSGMATAFCLAHRLLQHRPDFQFPKLLNDSSFFVYALHIEFSLPLAFFVVKAVFKHLPADLLLFQYLLVPVVIYAISVGAYWLMQKLTPGFLRLLTGNR